MTIYAKMRISNPSPYFETPDEVLGDDKLSRDEKGKVLRSMALDADQMLEATAEGMAGGIPAYNAEDLQSALVQLEEIKESGTIDDQSPPVARFQRIMVVATVDQDLNREIANIAFDMAETVGGKVFLLNVVPPEFEGARMAAAGSMVSATPLIAADVTETIDDRKKQLAQLGAESASRAEIEIEVRSGQIEEVVVDYANDCDADLIVVGSPHRSWPAALFNPSIARRVTKSAPCPVLIVPEPA